MKTSPIQSSQKTKVSRRSYDEQFKRDAVALIEGGRKIHPLARELGISHWNLREWKSRYGTGAVAAGLQARSAPQAKLDEASPVAMAAELADLRRELETTRRQRDILKKALAIVSQENPNSMI